MFAYYIGGPWDLTKREISGTPARVMIVPGIGPVKFSEITEEAVYLRHRYALADARIEDERVALYLYEGQE